MANKMTGHKWASHVQWVMSPVQVWFCLYVYSSVSQLCLFHMSQCQVCIFVHISWFLFYFNSLASRVPCFEFPLCLVISAVLSCLVKSKVPSRSQVIKYWFSVFSFLQFMFLLVISVSSCLLLCSILCNNIINNKGFQLSIVCIWFHLFLFTQSTLAYHDTNR